MPRISVPQLTSRGYGTVEVPNYSFHGLKIEAPLGGGEWAQDLARIAEKIAENQRRISLQNSETSAIIANHQFDGALKQAVQDIDTTIPVKNEESIKERRQAFSKKTKELISLYGDALDPDARRMFDRHISGTVPQASLASETLATKRYGEKVKSDIEYTAEELSNQAATSSLFMREIAIAEFNKQIENAKGRGFLDAIEAQRFISKFKQDVAVKNLMYTAKTNPDQALALFERGMYDMVDPVKVVTIIDSARRSRDAAIVKAERAKNDAIDTWKMSIRRETEKHIIENTLTRDWIEEYRYAMTDKEYAGYLKAETDQRRGQETGNPTVERLMQADVYNPNLDPSETYARLSTLYSAGMIGYEKFGLWANHLSSEINRRKNEGRISLKEDASRERQLDMDRYHAADRNLELALRTTNQFEDFDASATEALAQAREELQRRSRALGKGQEDALLVYNDIIPKYAAQVQSRAESRISLLQIRLLYPTKAALDAARSQIGEEKFFDQVRIMDELYRMRAESTRLRGMTTKPKEQKR